jgi:hypothetical protein
MREGFRVARIRAKALSYISWKKTVDQRLDGVYAITIEDVGLDDQQLVSHWKSQETPEQFVSWFGKKYELQPHKQFGITSASP